jgi:XTP/dITP diphosphohydrolase
MISSPRLEILVATRNQGKVRELRQALGSLSIKLRSLDQFPDVLPVDEIGRTYERNAVIKALGYAKQTGLCSLADDSGLEVDCLGGMPGVLSARFAGDHASDNERIDRLLREVSHYSDKDRTARFVCCMALAGWQIMENEENSIDGADPSLLAVTAAKCEGVIANAPRGANGFGFDPVFIPAGYDATFGELSAEVKAKISHRALAFSAMRKFLDHLLAQT